MRGDKEWQGNKGLRRTLESQHQVLIRQLNIVCDGDGLELESSPVESMWRATLTSMHARTRTIHTHTRTHTQKDTQVRAHQDQAIPFLIL